MSSMLSPEEDIFTLINFIVLTNFSIGSAFIHSLRYLGMCFVTFSGLVDNEQVVLQCCWLTLSDILG